MHLPLSTRDRSFYANFYSRHPSEIEIIDLNPSSTCTLRTLSESPTSITPLFDGMPSSITSGFFSSSDCSSSESTSSFTKRRRPTAPTIQARLNTYESACHRPSLPLPSQISSKQKILSPPSLVNQRIPRQISTEQIKPHSINTSNLIDNEQSSNVQDDSLINDKSMKLNSSKRYLSKSTSQLCDSSSMDHHKEDDDDVLPLDSRNILDVIQEELSEIRRADHDLKGMFISIYSKIQNIQQIKSSTTSLHHQHHKGHRYHYHHNDRSSRSLAHCCYSSNSDIRRINCTHHHHHNRKYTLHSLAALRNRMNNVRTSSVADNDSYVDTDSSSSESDSGTCSSPVDNEPCIDD